MGFIGRLLSTVSSTVLILLGASGANANTSPQDTQQQLPSVRGGGASAELVAGFILDTGGVYTEDVVEAAVRRTLGDMLHGRLKELPGFVRGLHSLGLKPEVEVAAVDTLVSMLEEQSGGLISAEQAAAAIGEVFEVFVEPLAVAAGDAPKARFVPDVLPPETEDESLNLFLTGKAFLPS